MQVNKAIALLRSLARYGINTQYALCVSTPDT